MNWAKYISKLKMFSRYFFPVEEGFKVNFVVAGVQKGGTTALDVYLREHPEICMAAKKEVHFFDKKEYFVSSPNYSLYHSFFNPSTAHRVIGEASPSYIFIKDSMRRIHDYNPEMKIMIILRDPIERAYSHWNMMVDMKKEDLPFREALDQEPERMKSAKYYDHVRFSYLSRGYYATQLKALWSLFSREQTLILRSDELKEMPDEVLGKVSQFLGVDCFPGVQSRSVHSRSYDQKISGDDIEYLANMYGPEMEELSRLTGWDISSWLVMRSLSSGHSH
jgi:hypothetical protein